MANFIFDFDGTLADSFDYVLDFMAREIQGPYSKVQKHHSEFRGLSMRLMATKLGAEPWQLPFLFLKGRKEMKAGLAKVEPFETIPELLRDLHADGHQLFLVSVNLRQNIMPFLEAHKLDGYFKEIVGNAIVFGKSPALRGLKRRYKLDPDQTWYIGDEGNDIRAAHRAGIKSVAVTWGYNNLERLQDRHPEVLAFTTDEIRRLA